MAEIDFRASLIDPLRAAMAADEADLLRELPRSIGIDAPGRRRIERDAAELVAYVRRHEGGLLESLMAEYGLADDEGLALMCLAEAYLRVPDTATIDALLRDKLAGHGWSRHIGHADSLLVNASTFGLLLSSQVLGSGNEDGALRRLVRRAGEPMVRSAVAVAMRRMAEQFVLGRTIDEAWRRAGAGAADKRVSFDMLGEAARTAADANRYYEAYLGAIDFVAAKARRDADVFDNPGVSVKLSALHPRYQASQRRRLEDELVPRLSELARRAAAAGVGLNVDAEEANRLELSLALIDRVLDDPDLAGWPGFGLVVQAYGKGAQAVLDWCAERARARGTPLAVRLVKGAYWDAEIRHAQLLGLPCYPVFTRKVGTDVAYLAGARRLLDHADWLYPQFATHNAHTVSAVLRMAAPGQRFEFQRLHGMGEAMHARVTEVHGTPCRVYAPVGAHKDLLAYLVRRMLENGANASFVHQLHDASVAPEALVADPIDALAGLETAANPLVPRPADIYHPRRNAAGIDPESPADLEALERQLAPWMTRCWQGRIVGPRLQTEDAIAVDVRNPARPEDLVGRCALADARVVRQAVSIAERGFADWGRRAGERRARVLEAVADAYEANAGELLALLIREAGKHRADAIAELREAVDFCRYYAMLARQPQCDGAVGRGVWACISPWNFPLAIFTGQIAAALAAGNAVVAKPAEQTPLIASRATELMLEAGVPHDAILLTPGDGPTTGAALVADPRIAGVSFTGSLDTACRIDRGLAARADAGAPLVAETGGLNAMIVDSTALPEAAVRDIIVSAFQSAGQRCSALRILFVQADIAAGLIEMLCGAMDQLSCADTADPASDVGPVIEASARDAIEAHIAGFERQGRLTHRARSAAHEAGWFVAPALIRLERMDELSQEVFGPVLHWTTFEAGELYRVIDTINDSGYGLTFGLHTRLDKRAGDISARVAAGNIYINRNQIGAVVGVQPFGGEGLSGTGPKAGGPHSLARLLAPLPVAGLEPAFSAMGGERARVVAPLLDGLTGGAPLERHLRQVRASAHAAPDTTERVAALERAFGVGPRAMAARVRHWLQEAGELSGQGGSFVGPTGETNRMMLKPRGIALCLGSADADPDRLLDQCTRALATGNAVLLAGPAAARVASTLFPCLHAAGLDPAAFGLITAEQTDSLLDGVPGPDLVLLDDDPARLADVRRRLAARQGVRVPVLSSGEPLALLCLERVISVDTTASGGNAQLLALAG